MMKKQIKETKAYGIAQRQEVIRSINTATNTDSNDLKNAFSDSILLKFLYRKPLFLSYVMIIYALIFSLLFPARENSIKTSISNYFSPFVFHGYIGSNGLMLFIAILFFIICCFCFLLSLVSIIKYSKHRTHSNKFYIYIIVSIFSLILNTLFLLNNLFLLHFCIVGFTRSF